MIKVKKNKSARVCQGDIYKNIEHIEYVSEKNGIIEISKIEFPLIIVLTQDCDLQQDYRVRWSKKPPSNEDKKLISVIVAPLYNEDHVYNGEHLTELGLRMRTINRSKTEGQFLKNNEIPRYHYLKFPMEISIVNSLIDFKHYFTVNIEYLKKIRRTNYICTLSELYRERTSQRFANYLARIGLPDAN
ncbi:MAG: hypothetical protein IT362_03515 [Deltaproteobacteria bacterium]|nr:hypothetical protein [Deltaproteobacteria bacterium]